MPQHQHEKSPSKRKKKSVVQLKGQVYLALKLYGQVCLEALGQWEHLPLLSGNSGPFSRQHGGKGTKASSNLRIIRSLLITVSEMLCTWNVYMALKTSYIAHLTAFLTLTGFPRVGDPPTSSLILELSCVVFSSLSFLCLPSIFGNSKQCFFMTLKWQSTAARWHSCKLNHVRAGLHCLCA